MAPKLHTDTSDAPAAGRATNTEAPGLGRSVMICAAAAFTIVFVAVAGALLATGSDPSTAAALGVFGAAWGGGGFGLMIGGVLYATRLETEQLKERAELAAASA